MTETVTLAEAEALARLALEHAGTATAAAASVARALARAEADGLSSHGLARIPPTAPRCEAARSTAVPCRSSCRLVPARG